MKKLLSLIAIAFLSNIFCITAQNLIAVQQSNTPKFYTALDTAIAHAVDGDTIYIPGGSYSLATNISKRLHIIGVGHNPDSTNVTGMAIISTSSYLYLITGSSGGSLTGVKITGTGLSFGTSASNGIISNYTVSRCNIMNNLVLFSPSNNNIFYENIITGAINGNNSSSNTFYNSIVIGNVYGFVAGNIFKNNIFLSGYIYNITNSVFMNNIFKYTSTNTISLTGTANNNFNSNLFVENLTFPIGTNFGSNNIVNQTVSSIFINQSGGSFNYTQDYHLQSTCPGKNAGTDGTDVGIYGGVFPWKTGSVPFNPHIQYELINGNTNSNGTLPANIRVGAQNH